MKLNFKYNKDRDVWNILNKGKRSNNSQTITKSYEEFLEYFKDESKDITEECYKFVDYYIKKNNIVPENYINIFKHEWKSIEKDFISIAEEIFNLNFKNEIIVYLSLNQRSPYNIKENYFYTSFLYKNISNKMMSLMHELWHFYTWYKFGFEWEEKLGKEKYNNLKESLTVLLNVECVNLLKEKVYDNGYPQHQELRKNILKIWNKNKDIDYLWEKLVNL